MRITHLSSLVRRASQFAICLVIVAGASAGLASAANRAQASFALPEEAVSALIAAVRTEGSEALVSIFGPEGADLAASGDPVADAARRAKFTTAFDEAHEVKQEDASKATLVIGKDQFPFPIPLVAKDGKWRWDTAAGLDEILTRRIGENELATIEVMRAYVDAQREYAQVDRDGHGLQYARKLVSSDGKRDGLSWLTTEGEPESPLGPLLANARAEGYTARSGHPEPYHGYVFRILTAQGEHAPGGALDYVVHGRMIGGFGLIAAPAQYGNSGVMTFIVNQDGLVYQKDLGPDTTEIAADIKMFDPDQSWRKVDAQ
jgi:hypothetical protein